MGRKKDICPVTEPGPNGLERKCKLPRDHIKLQSVKPGDKRSKFARMLSPHVFETRHPYR